MHPAGRFGPALSRGAKTGRRGIDIGRVPVKRFFYDRDFTIGVFFLGIGQDAFEEALYEEMEQLNADLPERNRSWIPAGVGHTFLRAEPNQTAGGVPVLDWVGYLLSDSEEWVSVGD